MEAKVEWLKGYRALVLQEERLYEELMRWRSLAQKVTSGAGSVPGGQSGGDRVGDMVAEIVQAEAELAQALRERKQLRRQIRAAIERLENRGHQLVLEYRYIDGWRWVEIAEKMFFSETQIYRMHRAALTEMKMGDNESFACDIV